MSNSFITKVDRASECIVRLKLVMRNLASKLCVEPGLLQQLLDNESLYIKQIPKDPANAFRVIAETTRLSQADFFPAMAAYTGLLKRNITVLCG